MPERSADWLRQAEKDLENAAWEMKGRTPVKPSVVQEKSYGSVKIFWLHCEEVLRRLREAARRLLGDHEEVEEVRLFGSLAEGRAIPGSDAVILLVLNRAEGPFPERPYLDYFAEVGLPCDLFGYTREELKRNPFVQKFTLKVSLYE
ncbi:nucleotidyltransferase domain-containing protein [Thermosulfurimonas dismutans]|uniref:Polymerase nucleotidyl transferase domain-containing protein n=1 Tax=Thermosulfurimonas dismutans TaxID=999894 RepID=A0A179D3V8_9BACT|nr:nucleotidyltransferase domain-containing protein [Thermosulfurimonas dismutans]OAQ20760.1 hypothetical protein TDIS_1216 [Thermosulfurimonas dismutans]